MPKSFFFTELSAGALSVASPSPAFSVTIFLELLHINSKTRKSMYTAYLMRCIYLIPVVDMSTFPIQFLTNAYF